MLSISNVSAKMATNYYKQDNYYARDQNDRDKWQGKLVKQLHLSEEIEPEQFNALINERPKLAGYDLTFSAPKSVSIAALATNETIKKDMLEAHNQAVEKILKEIEKNEIETRITKNGVTENIKTENMACGKFQHYVSRNSDMQLHTHAVILNQTEYAGKIYAIDNKNLYKQHILYGQLYRNELAKNLQLQGYEVEITDVERGFFDLKGMDKTLLDHFSTRRAEIMEQLKIMHAQDAASVEKATLLTRSAKEHRDLDELKKSWRATLDELGGVQIEKASAPIQINPLAKETAFDCAVQRLSERQFAFTGKELERAALAEGCTSGMTREDFQKALSQSAVIRLGQLKQGPDTYYTTETNLATEDKIKQFVSQTRETMPVLSEQQVKTALQSLSEFTLSNEQTQAVLHVATGKDQFLAVQGLAGTGKTYMLNAAREVLEKNGYKVRGASFSGKAAEGLQNDAKIKTSTLHSLFNKLEKEAGNANPDEDLAIKKSWDFKGLNPSKVPEVWVIDEAGLTDNNLMLHLQQAAVAKQAKVVLVGDYQQLAPVGAGNAYSNLVQSGKISTCYLTDIRRQKNEQLLKAVQESVKGDIRQSLSLVADQTYEIPSPAKRFKAITKEYTGLSAAEQNGTIILTAKNKERILLNDSIRAELIKDGKLTQGTNFTVQVGKAPECIRNFSLQDKVLFCKNDYSLGVKNGQTGKIMAIDGHYLTIQSQGKTVQVDAQQYNHFDHGYAITNYKSQGMTTDRAIINLDSTQKMLNSRNSYYVDISRARNKVSIYTDSTEKISGQVTEFTKKITSDHFIRKNIMALPKFQASQAAAPKIEAPSMKLPIPALSLLTKVIEAPVKIAFKIAEIANKAIEGPQQKPKNRRGMHM